MLYATRPAVVLMDPSQSRSCRRRRAAPAGNIEQPDANILPEQRSYGTSQRTVNSRNAVCAARDCGVIKYINNKMGIYVRLKRLPMAVPLRILTYSILTLIAVISRLSPLLRSSAMVHGIQRGCFHFACCADPSMFRSRGLRSLLLCASRLTTRSATAALLRFGRRLL